VLRVVRNPAQADEVTQEVFLDIWRQSARFDPQRGSALSWMLTIAHRRAVDRVRSAQATTERDSAWVAENQDTPHDSTAERAERSLDAQRVRNALDALTDTQRGAVELAYFGGYTHTEVAGLLDIPLGTAKTRIRDGLIRLRDSLGGAR
jgi:RNA polymerase sigma-70 factor (ECF subfamily)